MKRKRRKVFPLRCEILHSWMIRRPWIEIEVLRHPEREYGIK